jgi:pyruvate/2-oxoglutarate dehydrogenase complex dihydrolipoamide acyltransferase (E2) component
MHALPLYARPAPSSQAATQQAPAAPSPQPATTLAPRAIEGEGGSDRGGVLPLGATQDPVLDPSVRAQLEKLSVHVTLVVTVGEDGHTKRVQFQPALDTQTEQTIESMLASANWDAAVCGGGVSCEGTATIKL